MKQVEGRSKYFITKDGKVYSSYLKKFLRLNPKKNGYVYVSFQENMVKTTHRVHRLVAIAFIPNPGKLPFVNHKDGDKSNNSVDNLEWVDGKTNNLHAYTKGLAKVTYKHFLLFDNGKLVGEYIGYNEIMTVIKCSKGSICNSIKNSGVIKGRFTVKIKEGSTTRAQARTHQAMGVEMGRDSQSS